MVFSLTFGGKRYRIANYVSRKTEISIVNCFNENQ